MPRVFSKYFWNQIIIIQSWSEKNISRNYIFERSFKAGNISFGLLLFLVRLKQYSEDTFYLPNRSNCTIFHLRMAVHLVDIKCWGMGQIHHSNFRQICNNSSKRQSSKIQNSLSCYRLCYTAKGTERIGGETVQMSAPVYSGGEALQRGSPERQLEPMVLTDLE
jgi:hypothetical protein